MQYLTKILNAVKIIFSNETLRTFILLGTIAILIFLYWGSCQRQNETEAQARQNEEAMKKELKVEKNKNGELQTSVVAWAGKAKDLDKYSKELADELDAVKKSKVKIITKTVVEYKPSEPIIVNNTLSNLGDDSYSLDWKYSNEDSSRVLEGSSMFLASIDTSKKTLLLKPGATVIKNDLIRLGFIVGVKTNRETGFDEIFITPKTPGVTVSSLEGAILTSTKKKKYAITAGVGYGVCLLDGKIGLGPTINISIGKTIFSF